VRGAVFQFHLCPALGGLNQAELAPIMLTANEGSQTKPAPTRALRLEWFPRSCRQGKGCHAANDRI
jgi:hypothetical protein